MYVRNIKFESEFDGMKITATLKPLSFEDALNIQGINETNEDTAAVELARDFAPKLKEYVTDFKGAVDDKGDEVKIEEVCSVAYFAQLVVAMINKLASSAVPPQKPAELSAS